MTKTRADVRARPSLGPEAGELNALTSFHDGLIDHMSTKRCKVWDWREVCRCAVHFGQLETWKLQLTIGHNRIPPPPPFYLSSVSTKQV